MKRSDLMIVAGLGLVGLVAAFWFVVLAPKREEANELGTQVEELQTAVSDAEQLAAAAAAAEKDYGRNYHRLVVLGKAVPEDADTSSFLIELQGIADRSGVSFDSVALAEDAAANTAAVATPPPLTSPSDPSGEAPAEGESPPPAGDGETPPSAETPATGADAATPAAAVPATEAQAAALPIGAVVGPASLPVMPYDLSFSGGFFEIADFLELIDGLVRLDRKGVGVNGRLLTVDGFSLEPLDSEPSRGGADRDPSLGVSLSVTTYLTPAEEGLVAGATPSAPPAPSTTPASTTPAPTP